jgi:twitching motility protein PilT
MQSGKKHGMQTLADDLYRLYMNREVSIDECLRVSSDQNEFLRMIGQPVDGDDGKPTGPPQAGQKPPMAAGKR